MFPTVSNAPTSDGAVSFGKTPTPTAHMLDRLTSAAIAVQFPRDAEIVAEGDPAGYCFQVIAGCVRTVKLLEDGRRHVGAFLLPGDVFGWETEGVHDFAAEAVTPATLRRFRLSSLEERADTDRVFAKHLRHYVAGQVRMTRDRQVLLGRKTAAERIASFLLEMLQRLQAPCLPGGGKAVIELPMSRIDMADYLGLTIETVCRGLTDLRRQGVIAVERSRIAVRDRQALGIAGSERIH